MRLEPDALPARADVEFPRSYDAAVQVIASIMGRELGLPLPRRVTVFVYPTGAAYAEGLVSVGGISPRRASEISPGSIALGQHRRLFINDEALRGRCRSVWLALLAHELTHASQYETLDRRGATVMDLARAGQAAEPWRLYPGEEGIFDRRTRFQFHYHAHAECSVSQ